MIYIDDTDPEGTLEPSFHSRDVTIKRGVDAKELYELISEVGRGKFGTVYKCRERSTGLKLAAKFVPIPKREDRRNVEREVEIMNSLQHHLIIQLYAAYEYQKMMCVVLELVEGGELFDRVIDDDFVLTERVCTVFMRQVCEAMQFIHRNNILHLDMKPENILCLTKEGNRIKIIDFGLARKYDPDKKLQILFGTPEFVAPEVVNFDTISYGTDMWSVGVISYVLLSGLSPFMGETDIETMANVTVAKYDFDDEAFNNVSPEALEFISKLLLKDCSARMTATECLEHNWLQRKLKPPVAAKPVAPSPPKCVTTKPSPPRDIKPMELETTKDNLKTFIERWEEHPNSPYVFDTTANLISPLHDTKRDSLASSRVCTPSPCESICSLPETLDDFNDVDDENQKEQEEKDTNSNPEEDKNFKDYLQSFDRRNSDTSYILGRRHSGERMNLADEIRKLSDHLLMLAEINTRLGKENGETIEEKEECSSSSKTTVSQSNESYTTKSQGIVDETSPVSTLRTSNNSVKSNSTVEGTNSTQSVIKTKRETETETHKEVNVTSSKSSSNVSSLTVRLQSLEDTPLLTNGNCEEKGKKLLNGFKQLPTVQEGVKYTDGHGSCGVPWTVTNKRTKFKINQLSRDVPVGSPDSHQPFNLEEAANNTKDCLLHLLEKYNQTKLRNGSGGRHQSISVDWNISENLEYRTMSSINAFFQRHSTSGSTIKQLRAQLEAKCKQ